MTTKINQLVCADCGIPQNEEEFSLYKNPKNGKHYRHESCNTCRIGKMRETRKKTSFKVKNNNSTNCTACEHFLECCKEPLCSMDKYDNFKKSKVKAKVKKQSEEVKEYNPDRVDSFGKLF